MRRTCFCHAQHWPSFSKCSTCILVRVHGKLNTLWFMEFTKESENVTKAVGLMLTRKPSWQDNVRKTSRNEWYNSHSKIQRMCPWCACTIWSERGNKKSYKYLHHDKMWDFGPAKQILTDQASETSWSASSATTSAIEVAIASRRIAIASVSKGWTCRPLRRVFAAKVVLELISVHISLPSGKI